MTDAACPSCTALRQQLERVQLMSNSYRELLGKAGENAGMTGAFAYGHVPDHVAMLRQQLAQAQQETADALARLQGVCDDADSTERELEQAESRFSALTQAVKELARYEPVGNHMVTAIDGQNLKRADVIAAISPRPEAARDTPTEPTI